MNCQAPLAGDDDGVPARTTCHLCGGQFTTGDPDGHGLGECVPVCETCGGSGTAPELPAPGSVVKIQGDSFSYPFSRAVASLLLAFVAACLVVGLVVFLLVLFGAVTR